MASSQERDASTIRITPELAQISGLVQEAILTDEDTVTLLEPPDDLEPTLTARLGWSDRLSMEVPAFQEHPDHDEPNVSVLTSEVSNLHGQSDHTVTSTADSMTEVSEFEEYRIDDVQPAPGLSAHSIINADGDTEHLGDRAQVMSVIELSEEQRERGVRESLERHNQTDEHLPPPATWDSAYEIDRSYEARSIASNFDYIVPGSLLHGESCMVCLDACYDATRTGFYVFKLACGHHYHSACLYQWCAERRHGKAKCAACRAELVPYYSSPGPTAWRAFSGTTQKQRLRLIKERMTSVIRQFEGGEIDAVTAILRLDMLSSKHEEENHLGHS